MTQEEKQLLITDLCARLPYGVILQINKVITEKLYNILCRKNTSDWFVNGYNLDYNEVKPYLRPMSSMTEDEFEEYEMANDLDVEDSNEAIWRKLNGEKYISSWYHGTDWLNAHHFDYRGLIEKGLALEAPEGMYKMEE